MVLIIVPIGLWWSSAEDGAGDFWGLYPLSIFVLNSTVSYLSLCGVFVLSARGCKARQRVLALATLTLAVAIVVGLIELPAALRLVDYREMLSKPTRDRFDPELLHVHWPGTHFTGQHKGTLVDFLGIETEKFYDVDIRYDRNGFRNNLELEKSTVVVVGDSFVEASLVAFDEIATTRLARRLDLTVLNLGQPGYGPQQEWAALRQYGFPCQPRIVVWIFFEGNDLGDFRYYDRFATEGGGRVVPDDGFLRRSFSRNLLRKISKWTPRTRIALKRSAILQTPPPAGGQRVYFGRTGDTKDDRPGLAGTQSVISQAFRACRQRDAQFLLVFAPTSFHVYHDLCEFEPGSNASRWSVSDLAECMATWADAVHIPYLDLTGPLHAAAADGTLVYLPDDPHWSAEGNAVAAREIAAFLSREGWLDQL